jgi:hypothetical protein
MPKIVDSNLNGWATLVCVNSPDTFRRLKPCLTVCVIPILQLQNQCEVDKPVICTYLLTLSVLLHSFC